MSYLWQISTVTRLSTHHPDVHSKRIANEDITTQDEGSGREAEAGETTGRRLLRRHYGGERRGLRSQPGYPYRNHRMVVGAQHEVGDRRF